MIHLSKKKQCDRIFAGLLVIDLRKKKQCDRRFSAGLRREISHDITVHAIYISKIEQIKSKHRAKIDLK